VHAEYNTGRLPTPVALYERNALRSKKDVMDTIRGWFLEPLSGSGTGAEKGIYRFFKNAFSGSGMQKLNVWLH
jgi:hypothetical protein